MIDIESHKRIDIIFSRENNDVLEWLKSYPNIKVVSRYGSIIYKNAIFMAHPSAIQISDRFHILKNLTEYRKQYLIKYFRNYKAQNKNKSYAYTVTTEVKRSSLIKVLYSPSNKIKELSNEIISKIYNLYPIYRKIINLVIEFKNILSSRTIDT